MATTAGDLRTLCSRAGITLKKRATGRAGDDLAGAWFNLRTAAMGRSSVQRLRWSEPFDAQLAAVFDQPPAVLVRGAMSLAFEDVKTGLDLCADAVVLISGRPPRDNG